MTIKQRTIHFSEGGLTINIKKIKVSEGHFKDSSFRRRIKLIHSRSAFSFQRKGFKQQQRGSRKLQFRSQSLEPKKPEPKSQEIYPQIKPQKQRIKDPVQGSNSNKIDTEINHSTRNLQKR